ncbi:uncharacterized protein L201_004218 [Kwoniella dendrophila CBS 6074]|uniref:6-phosphogluconate dehydrogenase NADP-binding domain-containing protein n=1 Tax=Kwoniella dendrophila CBS 6074 TaxID=1295534 RepID=A0AAX4JVD5_9TREE
MSSSALSVFDKPKIGYIGLGNMGSQISKNLLKYIVENHLDNLTIWNRSKSKYDPFKQDKNSNKVNFAEELEEVVKESNIIFTMLIDDDAAQGVYENLFKAAKNKNEPVVFVDQSSLKAITSGKLAEQAKSVGSVYIASPVFGRPPMAESAKLLLVLSGPKEIKEKLKSLLIPAIGNRSVDVGEDVTKATALKSMGNMVLIGWIQLLSESYALGDSIGLDPEVFNNFLEQFVPAPPLLAYSSTISKGLFPSGGGFSVDGGLKDARNMISLGKDLTGKQVPLPTIELAKKNMERSKELGGPSQDWSSLAVAVREQAGLQPYREGTNNGQGN